jgi:purine-nucleoside phosphorylase
MSDLYSRAQEAADLVRLRSGVTPELGVILGSGLGGFASQVGDAVAIPYAEIPHFPQSTVAGHSGKLVLGTIGGVAVAVMQGRVHAYEGYAMEQVTFPTRVLGLLGCRTLIVTNAAGGIRTNLLRGSLVAISDHINLTGMNAAMGPNEARFAMVEGAGQRFFDMSTAYSPALRKIAQAEAVRQRIALSEGVFRTLGADLVGMSTVHEVIVARHMGIEVLGISLVTNMAAGVPSIGSATAETIQHDDVMEIGRRVETQLTGLLTAVIPQIVARA